MFLLSFLMWSKPSVEAALLAVSQFSGLVTYLQVPVEDGSARPVGFAIRMDSTESWIHSREDCPVFMDCDADNLILPGGSHLGSLGWSKEANTVFPEFQDVIGQLGLGPLSQVSKGRVVVVGSRQDCSLGISFESRLFEANGHRFEFLYDKIWNFNARPVVVSAAGPIDLGPRKALILIDIQAHDHEIPRRFFRAFAHWVVDSNRLYLECSSYDAVRGRFNQHIELEGAKVYIDKSHTVTKILWREGWLGFGRKRAFCPTNIVANGCESQLTLGKRFLVDFDIALDADGESVTLMENKNRFASLKSMDVPRVVSYRLDFSSVRVEPEGIQFDWIPATGAPSVHDFIFVHDPLIPDLSRIEVYLVAETRRTVPIVFPPVMRSEWSGSMKIQKFLDGRIRVKERRGSAVFDVSLSSDRFGFFEATEKAWRYEVTRADPGFIEFSPADGPWKEGEIMLATRLPAIERDPEGSLHLSVINGLALPDLPVFWTGVPLLESADDSAFVVRD